MNIGIIDADLIGAKKHRFPNLASMKISAYNKNLGNDVKLITTYDEDFSQYDDIYLSKVFTATEVPQNVIELPNIHCGGTGFFYDKAPPLKDEIEHCMTDYHLYDEWISTLVERERERERKVSLSQFKYYTDYSIGFTTRGCFRKCPFCVNQKYDHVFKHSSLCEFYDSSRKKICLLDDNILGFKDWKAVFDELNSTGKKFQYRQGMDERLLTKEKCQVLFSSNYDGDYTFAFDNIADYDLIHRKLEMIREYSQKQCRFYVLVAFDRNGKYDDEFWKNDIFDCMKRCELLLKYKCIPYVMRFEKFKESPYVSLYNTIASWSNQPSFVKKCSLVDFGVLSEKCGNHARARSVKEFCEKFPAFEKYAYMKYGDIALF